MRKRWKWAQFPGKQWCIWHFLHSLRHLKCYVEIRRVCYLCDSPKYRGCQKVGDGSQGVRILSAPSSLDNELRHLYKQPNQCIFLLSSSDLFLSPFFSLYLYESIAPLGKSLHRCWGYRDTAQGLMKSTNSFYPKIYDPHFQTLESEMQAKWNLITKEFLNMHHVEIRMLLHFKGSLLVS